MRKKLTLFILFITATLTVMAQNEQQAKLLRKAYKSHSTKMLYEFFDNWSEEVKSNEDETQKPCKMAPRYARRAHKNRIFAVC